jgi:hypothetical protein
VCLPTKKSFVPPCFVRQLNEFLATEWALRYNTEKLRTWKKVNGLSIDILDRFEFPPADFPVHDYHLPLLRVCPK